MKLKVQAQHLQIGDITGSGEKIAGVVISGTKWPSGKVCVVLESGRSVYWGKYTEINIEREARNDHSNQD